MLWLGVLFVVGTIGCIVYVILRADKKLKAKFEDKFNPADWDLPRSLEVDPETRPQPVTTSAPKVLLQYQTKSSLFTDAQRHIFNALQQSVSNDYLLLSSINVADVLSIIPNGNVLAMQVATQNMAARQFDVVICTKTQLAPVCAVILGNSLEPLLVSACESAHLPLVRFNLQATYDLAVIRTSLFEAMENQGRTIDIIAVPANEPAEPKVDALLVMDQNNIAGEESNAEQNNSSEPNDNSDQENIELPVNPSPQVTLTETAIQLELCPNCSAVMLKRKAKNGASAGKLFWICSDYPKCRGMVPVK